MQFHRVVLNLHFHSAHPKKTVNSSHGELIMPESGLGLGCDNVTATTSLSVDSGVWRVKVSPQPDTSLHCETHGCKSSVFCKVPVCSAYARTRCKNGQTDLGWLVISRQFSCLQMVIHLSTNRAQHRVSTLVDTIALPSTMLSFNKPSNK